MSQLESLFDEFNQEELQQVVKKGGEKSSEKGKKGDKKTSEDTHNKSMLFVRGIPKDATNTELEEFFSEVGPIRSCFVVTEKKEPKEGEEGEEGEKAGEEGTAGDEKPQNRGFGFVQFVLAEDAQRAVEELVDTKFRGKKRLMLDFAMKKHMKDAPGVEKPPPRAPKRPRAAPAAGDKDGSDEPAEKKRKKAANNESRTVTIQGIPKGTTKKQLIKKVKKSGNVHSVFYPTPFEGASPEQLKDGAGGSANVTFDDHAAAQRAVRSLNDHIFKGAKLKVMMKRELVDKNARLIVRNLPFKVRERELERLFSESGTVLTVDLPRKFVGGPLRGFAFIQMADVDSAQRAISKWNDHSLYGRNISVSLAVAKDKFKEMEESGEIEKPEFAEEPVAMEVDEENEDAEDAEGAEDADGDADGEDIKDDLVEEGCTLFIRNLSFDSDEDSLFEHFRQFGKLRYCRVVYDHETGRSRGTAFVCFWNSADAANCLAAAQKAQELSEKLSSVPSATLPDQRNKSVLLQETPASLEATAQFSLDGRMLSVAKAVDRSTANTLTTEGIKQRQSKDKRNTYLLKEGVIFPDTPAAQALAPADLEHHVKEYGQRKNQILKNPNLYLSKTRLSVHNIPRTIDEKDLRAAAISAISKFKHEAKEGQRKPLTKEEMAEGWDKVAKVVQSKIVCSTDRVDINTGKPRSKGYGFLEFSTHAHALACLRYLNFRNTKQAFVKQLADGKVPEGDNKSAHQISRRSLRVMFSIENAQIIKKRELRSTISHRKGDANDREDAKSARGGASKQRGGKSSKSSSKPSSKSSTKSAGGRKDSKKRFNKK